MSKEAMKLALEALESDPMSHAGLVSRKQAITALRQALETEPLEYHTAPPKHDYVIDCPRCGHCCPERTWVGLTLNEAKDFYDKYTDRAELINAIDKFLEEKNT